MGSGGRPALRSPAAPADTGSLSGNTATAGAARHGDRVRASSPSCRSGRFDYLGTPVARSRRRSDSGGRRTRNSSATAAVAVMVSWWPSPLTSPTATGARYETSGARMDSDKLMRRSGRLTPARVQPLGGLFRIGCQTGLRSATRQFTDHFDGLGRAVPLQDLQATGQAHHLRGVGRPVQ